MPRKIVRQDRVTFVHELIGRHPRGIQLTIAEIRKIVQKENPDCFKGLKSGPLFEWLRRRLPRIKEEVLNMYGAQKGVGNETQMPRPPLHFPKKDLLVDFETMLRSVNVTLFPFSTFGKILETMDILRTGFQSSWNVLLEEAQRIPGLLAYIRVLEQRLDERSHDNNLVEENANLKARIAHLEARCNALSQSLEERAAKIAPTVVHSEPTR